MRLPFFSSILALFTPFILSFVTHKREVLQQQTLFQGPDPPPPAELSPVLPMTLLMPSTAFSLIFYCFCTGVACLPAHSPYFMSVFSHVHHQVIIISSLLVFCSANRIDFPFCLLSCCPTHSSLRLSWVCAQLATSGGLLKSRQHFLLQLRASTLKGLAPSP